MINNIEIIYVYSSVAKWDYKFWKYPAGEVGIRIKHPNTYTIGGKYELNIKARLQNSDDIMALLLTIGAIKQYDFNAEFILNTLIIPCFPYSRQDRVATEGDPHSLQTITQLIDNLGFNNIEIIDAHSNVLESGFIKTKFHEIDNFDYVNNFICKFIERCGIVSEDDIVLISPDVGAVKKVELIANKLNMKMAICMKTRNPIDGKLSGFKIVDGDTKNKYCIIIDDLIDGGGTFLGLAEELNKFNPKGLGLFATHGIFSKGYDELFKYFLLIGCTDSYKDKSLYPILKNLYIQVI